MIGLVNPLNVNYSQNNFQKSDNARSKANSNIQVKDKPDVKAPREFAANLKGDDPITGKLLIQPKELIAPKEFGENLGQVASQAEDVLNSFNHKDEVRSEVSVMASKTYNSIKNYSESVTESVDLFV